MKATLGSTRRGVLVTAVLMSILSLVFCTKDSPTQASPNLADVGTIKGRIVDSTGTYPGIVLVGARGTNIMAITDSNGYYVIYEVPAGTYTISVLTSSDQPEAGVTVKANETATADDIVIRHYATSGSTYTGLSYFTLQNQNRQAFPNLSLSSYASRKFVQMLFLEADSVYISFSVSCYKYDSTGRQVMLDTIVTIARNNTVVYSKLTEKGRVATDKIDLTGIDTFLVKVGGDTAYRFCIVSSSAVPNTYINITTGRARLDTFMNYVNQFYVDSNSKHEFITLSNTTGDSVDFDIYFVNDQKHDTCYWRNKNPAWSDHRDTNNNPVFSGDYYYVWNTAPYYSDIITCTSLQDGSYSLYVKYTDKNRDVISYLPNLLIQIGRSPNISKLDELYQLAPPATFKKGDVWYAGKLTFPQKALDTTGAGIVP